MLISLQPHLAEVAEKIRRAGSVALDTEFVWTRTFYPKLGLVQAGLPDGTVFLLDTPALRDLSPLGEILADASIQKILHDAKQDLCIMARAAGGSPRNIFDTRLASGFAGLTSTLSLRAMLLEFFQIDLSKTETRTDWLRRPLSPEQLEYARADVAHLHAARDIIMAKAKDHGREAWLAEEMAGFDASEIYDEPEPRAQYKRIGGFGKLSARELAVLRELAAWRELAARSEDRPREHVLEDLSLMTLAKRQPRQAKEVAQCLPNNRMAAHYAEILVKAIETALALPDAECPAPPPYLREDASVRERHDNLLKLMRKKAEDAGIDPAMIAPRAEVEALSRDAEPAPERHRLLRGWRGSFIGQELLAAAQVSLNPAACGQVELK